MALTKVTEGVRTLGTGEVAIGNISGSAAASAGTFLKQDGTWAAIPSTDTSNIEDDIALLGFKVAANGSFGKYNLVDQTEDAFQDATGIDASLSTKELRDAAGEYYVGSSYSGGSFAFAGGSSDPGYSHAGGGGGGAGSVGANATSTASAGAGGSGRNNSYRTNVDVLYAAGGGGGCWSGAAGAAGGTGAGAGGNHNANGGNATVNTGSGGGGMGGNSASYYSGAGGAGIVVVRYLAAAAAGTGGTITTYGAGASQYQVHSFTAVGSTDLVLSSPVTADVLIVGGGGSGGSYHGGGGGAGAMIELQGGALSAATYPAVVGDGGAAKYHVGAVAVPSNMGDDSSFNGQTAKGGAYGGVYQSSNAANPYTSVDGGCGGGACGGQYSTVVWDLDGGASTQGDFAAPIADMSLVSVSTEAKAAPTTGDIVMTYSTSGGDSTTAGTDLTAEVSADDGGTWTDLGFVTGDVQGTTGGHTIISKHDVAITSTITAPYKMRYRIKTLNQTASKTTRIQAVSLGWS